MENCQNSGHSKPCDEKINCGNCGLSTCSANFAYHICTKKKMKKFICTTTVAIDAEDEDDARIELIFKMDAHHISWDVEEE